MKYQETILNSKKLKNLNVSSNKEKEKILLVKFNGQNIILFIKIKSYKINSRLNFKDLKSDK
jgi:hypothetical protein